jgi:restriction endonuclease Mrr
LGLWHCVPPAAKRPAQAVPNTWGHGGRMHDAQNRAAITHDGNIDGELTVSLEEFLRPIQWID